MLYLVERFLKKHIPTFMQGLHTKCKDCIPVHHPWGTFRLINHNTSASGGGSCRRPFSWTEMYDVNEGLHLPVVFRASMNPYVLSRYLARAPFGQGWIISIDNMEDLLAGHNRVSILTNIAAQWHIITKPSQFITRAFTWSGEAYLSYSLSAIAFSGFIAAIYSWYNNTVT